MTMHDMWLLTGHCAYSIDCERWEFGCGDCPDLDLYPAVKRDATRENWQRKIEILNRSKPHIVAPSHWVIRRAETVLTKAASYHVIPNGVNLNYFRPGDKLAARIALGLPRDGKIVLFVGSHAKRSRYKDYATIEKAFSEIAEKAATERITFVTVGDGSEAARRVGDCIMKQYPFVHSAEDMARFYQAADVFVHAANAETFGMVIVEAMATGLPVVATAVGGIPELVEHGKTGFLTQKGDATEMAARVLQLIRDETLPLAFSEASVRRAGKHYDLATSVTAHLSLYEEILNGPHATM
jgi:glycosyltransferase involved in cell wall biosynthesis